MPSIGKKYREIEVGQHFVDSIVVTDQMVRDFARVTGDSNPMHLDDAFAATTVFRRRVAHGMLTASLISRCIGIGFPGPGTIYLQQQLKFIRPVFIGDTITVQLEVVEKIEEKKAIRLSTTCIGRKGEIVLTGDALILPPT